MRPLHPSPNWVTYPLSVRSSKLSLQCADEARAAVLSFFKASEKEYTVIFTANATAALKLVGESYPFAGGSSLVLGVDSHNSVRTVCKRWMSTCLRDVFRYTVSVNLLHIRGRAQPTSPLPLSADWKWPQRRFVISS